MSPTEEDLSRRKSIQFVVHRIGNEMQIVMGFVELDQCDKAIPHIREVVELTRVISQLLK